MAADENGLSFLPFPRYMENQDRLKLVAVDGGGSCVEASAETIRDGRYVPLSRPLYVYTNRASLNRPQVVGFLRFYLSTLPRTPSGLDSLPPRTTSMRQTWSN